MGWVSLSLRKQALRQDINETQLQKLELSRQKRAMQREFKYEQTIFGNEKKSQLRAAKEPLDELRKKKPGVGERRDENGVETQAYKEWQEQYEDAQEKYEAEKVDINEYFDQIMSEAEEESTDEQTRIDTEQDQLQAQLEDMQQELQAVTEAISSDIQNTAIKFS